MGDVVNLNAITVNDIPAERVLNGALEANLDSAIVLGYTEDGNLYFASSKADGGEIMWLMETVKIRMLLDQFADLDDL